MMNRFSAWLLMLVVLLLVVGCETPSLEKPKQPMFRELYDALDVAAPRRERSIQNEPKVTVRASGITLSAFLRVVAEQADVSVVADASLDNRSVTVEVYDQPVSAVLSVVARRLNVQVSRSGDLFFMGSLRPEDKGVLVRKVGRLEESDLIGAVKTLTSEYGRVAVEAGGLLVVGDRVEVLQRVEQMLDELEAVAADTWVVQLYIMTANDAQRHQLGLDVVAGAELSAALVSGAGFDISHGVDAGLQGILQAARFGESIRMISEPLFLLNNGQAGSIKRGRRVPIVRNAITQEGQVVTRTDVEYQQTGLDLECLVREISPGQAKLGVRLQLSEIIGYVETFPILDATGYSSETTVTSGGIYLLGMIERTETNKRRRGLLLAHEESVEGTETVMIWCRVYQVGKLSEQ